MSTQRRGRREKSTCSTTMYNHRKGGSKDMDYRRTGSTWFKIKHVIAKYHSAGLEAIFDSTLRRALMAD
eukprot:4238120-Prorocentrum_lima.AAC.1